MGPEAMHWRDRALKAEAEVKRLRSYPDHGVGVVYDPATCPCQRCVAQRAGGDGTPTERTE
jgi:hypothetical protein